MHFDVAVPPLWRKAERLMLLARDVSLPKNQPVVLKAYVAEPEGEEAFLGSYGVPGESETATGRWSFETLRITVTRPLRRWLEARPTRETIPIRLEAVDGSGRALEGLEWKVRALELEAAAPARLAAEPSR